MSYMGQSGRGNCSSSYSIGDTGAGKADIGQPVIGTEANYTSERGNVAYIQAQEMTRTPAYHNTSMYLG